MAMPLVLPSCLGLPSWFGGIAHAADSAVEAAETAASSTESEAGSTESFVAPLTFITAKEFELIENGQLKAEQHDSAEPIVLGPIHEGHAQIFWVPDPHADAYRLSDQAGHVVYTGRFTKAFVSGLPTGRHEFSVVALDEQQNVLRGGSGSTVVDVAHWSLAVTWSLFALGAIVFLALIAVLTIGHRRTRTDASGAGNGPATADPGATDDKTESLGSA